MAEFFSTNLKFLREQRGLSQNKLGAMIGVNQTTIARWEDDNRVPTIDNAVDVSNALNVPLPDLLGKDLRLENTIEEDKLNDEEEKELLKQVFIEKGLMKKGEDLSQESFDRIMEFTKNNLDFLIDKKDNS